MKLRYVIVWFEDSRTFVNTSKTSIEEHLQELGFSPTIVQRRSGARSLQLINSVNPDLILIDVNLAGKAKGQDIVEKIRNNELYTDVVFYSQHPDFLNEVGKLEGVFYCDRGGLEQKTQKIIDITVKREQDVNNLRGVLIAEAIDIERKMESFITHYLGLSKNEEKRSVFEKLYKEENFTFQQKYKFAERILQKAIARTELKLQAARSSNSSKVEELSTRLNNLKTVKQKFDRFGPEVIKLRNIMAHVEEVQGQSNVLHVHDEKGNLVVVDDDYCNSKRKSVGGHSRNLQSLMTEVART
jgi:CheY-like chemotaxis protein